MATANDRLVTRKEAAEILGIKLGTLAEWAVKRKDRPSRDLPVIKVGKLAKYRLSDIEQFIVQNRSIPRGSAELEPVA